MYFSETKLWSVASWPLVVVVVVLGEIRRPLVDDSGHARAFYLPTNHTNSIQLHLFKLISWIASPQISFVSSYILVDDCGHPPTIQSLHLPWIGKAAYQCIHKISIDSHPAIDFHIYPDWSIWTYTLPNHHTISSPPPDWFSFFSNRNPFRPPSIQFALNIILTTNWISWF